MAITVKVVRVPGTVKEVVLNDGATVADALRAASLSLEHGENAKVNGADAQTGAYLRDGDAIVLAKGAKGNA